MGLCTEILTLGLVSGYGIANGIGAVGMDRRARPLVSMLVWDGDGTDEASGVGDGQEWRMDHLGAPVDPDAV